MIDTLSIRNFKNLRDVRVTLERFTIFVGPNASGKSSLLQGLHYLCRIFPTPGQPEENLVNEGLSRGADAGVELTAETGGQCFRYRSRAPVPGNGAPGAGQGRTGPGREVASNLDSGNWTSWKASGTSPAPLPSSVLLRLEASRLILPQAASPDPTVMAPDGTGLHTALASMALNDPDSWQALQTDLRRIIPSIRRLRHTKTAPAALLFDTLGGDSLPASQVSEGTLLVLGLLAALHAPGRPNLVLLDDMDRGLHPKAQKELVTLLRGLMDTNSDLQLVATTHSPYLLDWMKPSEVRMTCLGEDGATVCASIEKHPKFEKWKDEMAPGEMWSLFGEKWLVETRAAS